MKFHKITKNACKWIYELILAAIIFRNSFCLKDTLTRVNNYNSKFHFEWRDSATYPLHQRCTHVHREHSDVSSAFDNTCLSSPRMAGLRNRCLCKLWTQEACPYYMTMSLPTQV